MAMPLIKIYVGNISDAVTHSDLRSLFQPFGVIAKTWMPDEWSGYAFVVRSCVPHARSGVAELRI